MDDVEKRICEALKELVERQPIGSIGVQAVCDKADISRKTFSRRFGTIQAVVELQIASDFIQPIVEVNKLIPAESLASMALVTRNLNIFQQNRTYYDAVIKEYGASWFAERLAEGAVSMEFRPYDNLALDAVELDFVENLFASSVAWAFCWWFKRGMDVPPEEVANMLNDWLYAHFREVGKCEGGVWASSR